jgi:hypothetical protein
VRTDLARWLLPQVENRNWFFDTELLVLAQRAGLRIHEIPVDWTDDSDSRLNLVPASLEDLQGVWRLMLSGFRTIRPPRAERAHREAVMGSFGARSAE